MIDKIHPLADTLPLMSDTEYRDLLADIRVNGLLEPITLYEGKVLDGRHRLRACHEAGIEPRFKEYTDSDPAAFVLSKNIQRRHLTPSERAAVVIKINELVDKLAAEAKQRRRKKLKQGCTPPLPSRDGNGDEVGVHPESGKAPSSPDPAPTHPDNDKHANTTTARLGELAGVSEKTMERTMYVYKHGTPEDIKEVESGEKTVSQKENEIRQRRKSNRKSDTRNHAGKPKRTPTETDEDLIHKEWQTCIQTMNQMLLLDPSILPAGEAKDRVACFRRALEGKILGLQDMVAMIEAVDGLLHRGREVRRQLVAKKKEAARAARSQQGSRTTASAKRSRGRYDHNTFWGLPKDCYSSAGYEKKQ